MLACTGGGGGGEVASLCLSFFQGTLGQREPSPAPQGEGRQINAEALIFQMKTYYCSLALSPPTPLSLPLSLLLAQSSGP